MLATYLLLQGAVFTVFPEEVIITTLGVLCSQDKLSFIQALLAVQAGLLPANLILVVLGNRLGPGLFKIRPFRWFISPEAVAAPLQKLHRSGAVVVFLTRFVPLIRGPVYFAAGLARIRPLRFFMIDATASFIQIPALLFLGSTIGKNSASLLQAYQRVGLAMAFLLGGTLAATILRDKITVKSTP